MPCDPLRISVTKAPDPRIRKRIVIRNASVRVHPKDLPCKRVEALSELAVGRVPGRDVEFAVRPKCNAATGVKLRRGNVVEQYAINACARSIINKTHEATDHFFATLDRV